MREEMGSIKVGMYVRCPVDLEYPKDPRRFAMGQIKSVNEVFEKAQVRFWDFSDIIHYYKNIVNPNDYYLNTIYRVKIIPNSIVEYNGYQGVAKTFSHKDENDYYVYYIEVLDGNERLIEKVPEYKIKVQFTQADVQPLIQMKLYEFQNPRWYFMRRIVSKLMNVINNSSYGFEYLVGSRVHLLQHQVETVVRALSAKKCRFMLADEVGLGKTIEACAILKGLKIQTEEFNSLLLIPQSLAMQWKNELHYKFNIDIDIWSPSKSTGTNVIIPMELLEVAESKGIFDYEWDILIVDETHNLLKNHKNYTIVEKISRETENVLLLSATPVLERKTEYLELLKLLKPDIYGKITLDEFKIIVDKQSHIQERVYPLLEDLDNYIEEELYEDYIEDLEDIQEILNDKIFNKLVAEIDNTSEDKGLKNVSLCLAYLGEYYQMEKHVIRHRRQILKRDMANRTLLSKTYDMSGADTLFYEETVYEELKIFISKYFQTYNDIVDKEIIKNLFSAMFSSPWALIEELDIIISAGKLRELNEDAKQLKALALKWKEGVKKEFNNWEELHNYPDMIKGRLLFVLDHLLEQLDDTKIVVFSQYTSTLKEFEKVVKLSFGDSAYTVFHKELDSDLLNENADRFQNDPCCRFILCDELGGEGRNFQIANQIVHIDLPWSANALEQRIGRLDRLGRDIDKDVLSVVIYSQNTIEEELFKIWDKGLNVFNNSLSGLEIILGDLNNLILDSLYRDLDYGLLDAINNIIEKTLEMKNYIKREEYFDIASQLSRDTEDMLFKLIESFSENNGEILSESMMSWAHMTGLHSTNANNDVISFSPEGFSIRSAQNTLFIPPKWRKYQAYFKKRKTNDIRGTFNRELAIKREDLLFFAPGDVVFDSIVNNAMICELGKCCAFTCKGDFNFNGFVFTWMINPNINYLLDMNENIINLSKFRGYLPLEQIISVIPIDEKSSSVDSYKYKVVNLLDENNVNKKAIHLGERSSSSLNSSKIKKFKEMYPTERWKDLINDAYKKSLEDIKENIRFNTNIKGAKKELDRILYANKVSQMYFNNSTDEFEHFTKIREAILKGLYDSKAVLDSVAFIQVVDSDE
jgi:ATP-dependent helicase HepA